MKHGIEFATVGILVWSTAISAAAADSYRAPQTGNPALVVEAPPGWTGADTRPGEVTISNIADTAVLELSVISDPAMTAKSLPDVAREVLVDADLTTRWTSTEPDSIAGLPGQAFIIDIVRNGEPSGLARLIVAKIDASHAARVTEITLPKGTSPSDLAQLKSMVSGLRVSGH